MTWEHRVVTKQGEKIIYQIFYYFFLINSIDKDIILKFYQKDRECFTGRKTEEKVRIKCYFWLTDLHEI